MPKAHIRVEPYCVLCHDELETRSQLIFENQASAEPNSYKTQVLCFFRVKRSSKGEEKLRPYFFSADLSNCNWELQNSLVNKIMDQESLAFCLDPTCAFCDLEDTLNFAHTACFQLGRQTTEAFELVNLVRISRMNRPITDWQRASTFIDICFPFPPWPKGYENSTDLGKLISDMETHLPPELRRTIYERLTGFSRVLLLCSATLRTYNTNYKEQEMAISNTLIRHSLEDCLKSGKIGATFTSIFGEDCFRHIVTDGLSEFDDKISFIASEVVAIQVSLGTYGVLGMAFLYRNGKSSSWLGKSKQKWTNTYEIKDFRQLYSVSDGFKIVHIGLSTQPLEPNQLETAQFSKMLWDRPPKATDTAKHFLIDAAEPGASVRASPTARFGQYMNLHDEKIECLTMFCSGRGVCSIQINGNFRQQLGRPRECVSLTYFFQKQESIKTLHVVTWGSKVPFIKKGPYLLVATCKGRTLYYGPQTLLYLPDFRFSSFPTSPTEGATGIFIDPTTSSLISQNTIGVTIDHRYSQPKKEHVYSIPGTERLEPSTFLSINIQAAFLTTARLVDVQQLHLQKFNGRCTGLRADHDDGSISTLGQWDPSSRESISLIYKSSDGPLSALKFMLSDSPNPLERYVVDLIVVISPATNKSLPDSFFWENLSSEVAWWFTVQYDHIELWTGGQMGFDMPPTSDILPTIVK